MRILHLAYEDPRQPGSGGGSIRTREVNRRLAVRHQITALVAGYPGAKPCLEDGIHWIPISSCKGSSLDRLSYFALMGSNIAQHSFDLVVEDFGAPFSVGFSPIFTRKPVVASVQWLFAQQMRDKYHLPFDLVQNIGLPLYRDFITVSVWLAETIRQRCPNAYIEPIFNGVDELAFAPESQPPEHFLFVGRLDTEQKGCDLLLRIFAIARNRLGELMPPLVVVGDGPDRQKITNLAEALGLGPLVQFRGRVDGIEKYNLMARSYAVLVPSRFETFGMVAVEAQAAGAPVIAFDVGPLAEVVGPGGALLAKAFDLESFADHIVAIFSAPQRCELLRQNGRLWAKRYNWDEIANQQEMHYLRTVENHAFATRD